MDAEAVTLVWRVRDSLVAYMSVDPAFEVEVVGEASFSPEAGVRLPARRLPDGRIVAEGGVILRAHGGALQIPLVDVRVEDGALWVRDPEDAERGLRLVTVAPSAAGGADVFDTALAPEADLLFMYNYAPGVPFAPLSVEAAV
ncbi:hypothetical protein AB0N73_15060 [Microbacterium sp. NPDC089189]|uniref:hypothetical protein n=1 Tax=Microbacterium sp. NPDC089189 TaxID=3154972 RepID=UPI00342C6D9D